MTDASSVIARLRELHKRVDAMDLAKLDEEAAILSALPPLLLCAETLAEFSAHYPYGINPYLDEAASNARAALAALAKVEQQ